MPETSMKGRHVGYVRVSTHDQNTARQLADCKVDFWKVYEEKASGKNTDRPELQDCLSRLDEGDTLWIHSIDRLARSLQQEFRRILVKKADYSKQYSILAPDFL